MVRVAVVGAGAAGVAAVHALSEQLGQELELTMFDETLRSTKLAARGLPYRGDRTQPLLNAPAHFMSISAKDDRHFMRWHEARFGFRPLGHLYATRPVFGEYLLETLHDLRQDWAQRGQLLHLVPHGVERIEQDQNGLWALRTNRSQHFGFDRVVLCTGWSDFHAHSTAPGAQSVYPLEDSTDVAMEAASVLILGSGLAAVDAVRALLTRGYGGQIRMASRRGLLPNVRPDRARHTPITYTRPYLAERADFTLANAISAVRTEALLAEVDLREPMRRLAGKRTASDALRRGVAGEDDAWAAMLVGLADEVMSDTWSKFSGSDKRLFLRTLHPYFQSWCNPMPRATANLLLEAVDAGQLRISAGAGKWDGVSLRLNTGEMIRADVTLQAHRSGSDHFAQMSTGLFANLIGDGYARADPFGGLELDYATSRVVSGPGTLQAMYAVGAPAQGARYYVSALDGIVRAATAVAADIRFRSRESDSDDAVQHREPVLV